jgi:hypothetical protein
VHTGERVAKVYILLLTLMKKLFPLFLIVMFLSCSPGYSPASTALEGGREFIDACLTGDFDKAAFYMIDDSGNNNYLLKIKRDFHENSSEQRIEYGKASINIIEDAAINDSTHIINYKNSYDNIARKVKVIRRDDKWLVDFKYTFNGNL